VVPFPPGVLGKLAKILKSSRTEIVNTGLERGHIKMLVNIGLITSDRRHVYPTDEGRLLSTLIKTLVG
jgi:hypothetical protein